MARSRKRTSIHGIAVGASDKHSKRIANRKFRSRIKRELNKENRDFDSRPLTLLREVSNVWNFSKDGKCWMDPTPELMRK